ncbi:MAG: hypothetical protein O7E57_17250 [Gammaproteobacteria bacterium]|nr:hypothetical protein [Gammaproteobacteria bacterium]
MATANDKGASVPTQYPLIVPDDPETTYLRTEAVLAFVQEFAQARALSFESYGDNPPDDKHLWGLIYIISGCRDAVTALGHMALPDNVTKLEVGDD